MLWKRKPYWIAGLVALAVPMTALAAAPETTTEFVLDLWNSRGYRRQVWKCQEADARMDVALREAGDRMSVKEQLIGDLLAGRLSFVEVVQRFELLNAGLPTGNAPPPAGCVAANDEEKAALSVLSYVAARGEPLGHVLPRLAAAYEARYGRPVSGRK